jgi:hypothetical protein
MTAGKNPPRSRLGEKSTRAPRPHFGRFEKSVSQYLGEIKSIKSEPARLTRFAILLSELFGELDFPLLRDFLAGFEARISAHEGKSAGYSEGGQTPFTVTWSSSSNAARAAG